MPVEGWLNEATRERFQTLLSASAGPLPLRESTFRFAPERPYRLWLQDGSRLLYLDYSQYLEQFPVLPPWSAWSQARVDRVAHRLCLPDGLKLILPQDYVFPREVRRLTWGAGVPFYYRPLYDQDGQARPDVGTEYDLSPEQLGLLQGEYPVPNLLINQRLMDLASCFKDYLALEFKLMRDELEMDGEVEAREAFQSYLRDPVPNEFLRAQYGTRLELIQAGGLRQVEMEWLGHQSLRTMDRDPLRVQVRNL